MTFGRHYVSQKPRGFRKYTVERVDSRPLPGRKRASHSVKIQYVVVSRHFTWKGANKACRRLNAERGNSTP